MIITLVAFLFILGFAITIHELGHFLTAKVLKIPVLKFSLGWGPALFRKKIGDTDFIIAIIPVGGYVKIAGEEEGEGGWYDEPFWKRILVVFYGPVFNIISAFLILFSIFSVSGVVINPYTSIIVEDNLYSARAGLMTGDTIKSISGLPVENWESALQIFNLNRGREVEIKVGRNGIEHRFKVMVNLDSLGIRPNVPPILGIVQRGEPAWKAGLKKGDRIISIDDRAISTWDELVDIVRHSPRETLTIRYLRADQEFETKVITRVKWDEMKNESIGVMNVMMNLEHKAVSIPEALSLSLQRSSEWILLTVTILYKIITGEVSRKNIGGPIAIAKTAGESARWGLENLLLLLAIISINLGIVNLVPIPLFDGGLIVMNFFEGISGRPIKKNVRFVLQQIGIAIIVILILFTLYNDITR